MKEPNDSMEAKPTVLGGGALAWGAYSMGERGGVFFLGGWGVGRAASTSAGGSAEVWGAWFVMWFFAHAHFGDGGFLSTCFIVARGVVSHYAFSICDWFQFIPSFSCLPPCLCSGIVLL